VPKLAGIGGFIRGPLWQHMSIATAAATVSADFNANTLLTIAGGANGFTPGVKAVVEKLRFFVGDADFVGGGGTLTFELRRDTSTGTAIASLTIALASALRGAVLEASVADTATAQQAARIDDTTKLFLVRTATGTVYTTASGRFEVVARQQLQAAR
jgi:hypothetical protein